MQLQISITNEYFNCKTMVAPKIEIILFSLFPVIIFILFMIETKNRNDFFLGSAPSFYICCNYPSQKRTMYIGSISYVQLTLVNPEDRAMDTEFISADIYR